MYEYKCENGFFEVGDGYKENYCLYSGEYSSAAEDLISCERIGNTQLHFKFTNLLFLPLLLLNV